MTTIRLMIAMLLLAIAPCAAAKTPAPIEQTIAFDNGAGRMVPVTIVSKRGKVRGVILFSHGALSNPAKYAAMTHVWAEKGYVVVAPLHADSSDWTGLKPAQADQLAWRMADMKLAAAQADTLAAAAGVRLGKARWHAAGHSFGALIAMLIDDPRVTSLISFSPPGPLPMLPQPVVAKPMFTVTGTADVLPMIAPTWDAHLASHRKAVGLAIAYVAAGGDHYFGGVFGRPELPGPRQRAGFDEAMALSLAFLKSPVRAAKAKGVAGSVEVRN